MIAVLWMLLLSVLPMGQKDEDAALLAKVEAAEFEVTRSLATALYDAGDDYLKRSFRKEAIFFLKRCLEIRPRNGPIGRLASLLQDYDNPIWKKKKWRSPKGDVEQGFLQRKQSLDDRMIAARVKMGHLSFKYAKSPQFLTRAVGHFRRALEIASGPFEIDSQERIVVGPTAIDPEPSKYLIENELSRINGAWYLRDDMLRALGPVAEIHEAKGKYALVRALDSLATATSLQTLLDAVCSEYIRVTSQTPSRPLVLLVLPDRATYEKFCVDAKCSAFMAANGLASASAGYAITFIQPDVETIAIHEGAHVFHDITFASDMPSWYDEGFANSFGAQGTWQREGTAIRCELPLALPLLAPLRGEGFIPLERLLHDDVADYWSRNDPAVMHFYAQSWALYTFLSNTTDPRFRKRFDEWEGFALGAGYGDQKTARQRDDAAKLFDRIFADVKTDLESALIEWIEALAVKK